MMALIDGMKYPELAAIDLSPPVSLVPTHRNKFRRHAAFDYLNDALVVEGPN
jgi:hypothetical protein